MSIYNAYGIPSHAVDSFQRYVEKGSDPGSFMMSMLKNDLAETFSTADEINARIVVDYVRYMHNELPSPCWGSPEKVAAWIASKEETVHI